MQGVQITSIKMPGAAAKKNMTNNESDPLLLSRTKVEYVRELKENENDPENFEGGLTKEDLIDLALEKQHDE